MPTEKNIQDIPVKWSNIISKMSAGSRSGMHFSDTNNSATNNYPEKVSTKLFTYSPNNNATVKSNGKTFQLNIIPYDNNTDGAFSYISKNRKFCENVQTVTTAASETNPKSTNSVANSHANFAIMVTNTATDPFDVKTNIDGNKYKFKSCSVPLQRLKNTDALNGTSGKLLNCENCEKDKNCAEKELQVCLKCIKNLKKVCASKLKGNMSRVSDLIKA